VKSFAGEHQPLPDLTWENKNSKALMARGHKNSTGFSQGKAKNLPHSKRTRGETPLGDEGVEPPSLNTQQKTSHHPINIQLHLKKKKIQLQNL
jgi:hypothetical protein